MIVAHLYVCTIINGDSILCPQLMITPMQWNTVVTVEYLSPMSRCRKNMHGCGLS
jgi:hypothetical protein